MMLHIYISIPDSVKNYKIFDFPSGAKEFSIGDCYIVFYDGTLKAASDNYISLTAHTQEELKNVNDILEKITGVKDAIVRKRELKTVYIWGDTDIWDIDGTLVDSDITGWSKFECPNHGYIVYITDDEYAIDGVGADVVYSLETLHYTNLNEELGEKLIYPIGNIVC